MDHSSALLVVVAGAITELPVAAHASAVQL